MITKNKASADFNKLGIEMRACLLEGHKLDIIIKTNTENISRMVVDFQDRAVREALIKLGWTPPLSQGKYAHEKLES